MPGRLLSALLVSLLSAMPVAAATMWVHDSAGRLGTVDTTTGTVNVVGTMPQVMTDIAFDPLGNLFGITFTGLYSVNKSTAATSFIGNHGVSGGNALVFGSNGTLYAAGNTTQNLFTLNTTTGAGTSLGSSGFSSGGDLAFVGDNLYLATTGSQLVSIDLSVGPAGTVVGPFGVSSVFGIASTGAGDLFAVAGTTIYKVNLTTGAAFDGVSFAGQGLGQAFGQGFFTEAGAPDPEAPPVVPPSVIPLPASVWLLLGAIAGMGLVGRRSPRCGRA